MILYKNKAMVDGITDCAFQVKKSKIKKHIKRHYYAWKVLWLFFLRYIPARPGPRHRWSLL